MIFNKHSIYEGQHAFLGASQYHWLGYDEEKLANRFSKYMAAQRGTELHNLAKDLIRLGVNLPKSRKTFNMYVNDAIGFKMQVEQVLFYSENCYGTADAIKFDLKSMFLRIHDLKNGETPASMKQLLIYAALFCLEYGFKPSQIETELRLYQLDEVQIHRPEPDEIVFVMDKIVSFDKAIEKLKIGG